MTTSIACLALSVPTVNGLLCSPVPPSFGPARPEGKQRLLANLVCFGDHDALRALRWLECNQFSTSLLTRSRGRHRRAAVSCWLRSWRFSGETSWRVALQQTFANHAASTAQPV